MSQFERRIEPNALELLRRLAESPEENWWKDLLRLWRPSGSEAEEYGLRLAVRNNYLNFYLRGQSVARVAFVLGEPSVSTHVKYVFGPDEGQGYAQMRNGKEIRHPVTGAVRRYEGSATLHQWIKEADTYKGDEKTCVDKLVAENPSIIDLEMGLPKIARRMDCIALECDVNAVRIVFWEAKMIDDSRLRSRTDPEVIDQLRKYQEFLKDEGRARRIQIAYQTTCQLLNEIHRMALRFTDQPALDPLVMAAADRTTVLKVDPVPRLVIFGGTPYQKKGKWELHQARLESEKIPCLVFCDQPYRLRRAEVPA